MGKDLKGKELCAGICQRKDGKYAARFTSITQKRIESHFDKVSEAKKWLAEAKYEDEHSNVGASSQMTVNAWFDFWITNIKEKTTRHNTVRNYILGHSTLAVTMNTYVHITDDEKEKEMKKFEEAFKIS